MIECNSREAQYISKCECNFTEWNPLHDQQQFRLNKINEIKSFVAKIKERELMSRGVSKYVTSFDYLDKSLIVLSVTTGSNSIASFSSITGAPVGIASASLFSISARIVKKLLKTIRNKKKKHKAIARLAGSN